MIVCDRFDHNIDDKNRLAIPSQVRNAMDPEIDGNAFYLLPEGRYLQLIPENLFKQLSSVAPAGLAMSPAEAKARRLMFAMASRLDPDKTGRVIIPERFMVDSKNRDPFSEAALGHEVTLVGVGDRMEIWNRADLTAHLRELLADRAEVSVTGQKLFSAPARTNPSNPGSAPGSVN